MEKAPRILMFTFESIYTRKVGGLAEVPPRLGAALEELGATVEVYTPSHGAVDACREPIYVSPDGYCISRVEGSRPLHFAVGGGVLDDPVVYSPEELVEKAMAFAKAVSSYLGERLPETSSKVVFHAHDWHSYPVLLALNAITTRAGKCHPLVYHVHALSKTRLGLDAFCNWLGVCSNTLVRGSWGIAEFGEYYEASGGLVERLAALTVDLVVTVSRGYSKTVMKSVGPASWSKVDYVPNASPVEWAEVRDAASRLAGLKNPELLEERLRARKLLLTSRLAQVELSWGSPRIKAYVEEVLGKYGLNPREPFKSDGPLLFAIGRLSRQKGFDVLLRALDRLTLLVPRIRVVVAAAPTEWSLEDVKWLAEHQLVYRENLRVLPGMLGRGDALLFYYAANATAVPSRSEPFGLVALESMASGTPVAASRVEGLADIVLDLGERGSVGTGVLFEPEDPRELAEKTAKLVELVEEAYYGGVAGRLVRELCIKRAREFSWRESAKKALEAYKRVLGGVGGSS